jgi:3-oxoacyl-(acyl-carrier-protein) synthase
VLTILSLREGILPRSFGFSEVDPRMNVAPTTVITPGDFKSALSFSLGFGGTNAVLCLGRAT